MVWIGVENVMFFGFCFLIGFFIRGVCDWLYLVIFDELGGNIFFFKCVVCCYIILLCWIGDVVID